MKRERERAKLQNVLEQPQLAFGYCVVDLWARCTACVVWTRMHLGSIVTVAHGSETIRKRRGNAIVVATLFIQLCDD